jgi:hypothetical protein
MRLSAIRPALFAAVALIAATASAQTLKPNQTLGFGNSKVLTFTYTENFDCVEQPGDDLNYNGIPADKDPAELQTPICQSSFSPDINPWTTTRMLMTPSLATTWSRERCAGLP